MNLDHVVVTTNALILKKKQQHWIIIINLSLNVLISLVFGAGQHGVSDWEPMAQRKSEGCNLRRLFSDHRFDPQQTWSSTGKDHHSFFSHGT